MIQAKEITDLEFFKDLSESGLDALASVGVVSRWQEGETIFRVRAPATHLFVLKSGSVLLAFPDGRSLPVREPGRAMGWSALMNPFRHTATALCLTDVDLYQFSREELYRLIQMDSDFGQALMEKIARVMHERKPYHRIKTKPKQ